MKRRINTWAAASWIWFDCWCYISVVLFLGYVEALCTNIFTFFISETIFLLSSPLSSFSPFTLSACVSVYVSAVSVFFLLMYKYGKASGWCLNGEKFGWAVLTKTSETRIYFHICIYICIHGTSICIYACLM